MNIAHFSVLMKLNSIHIQLKWIKQMLEAIRCYTVLAQNVILFRIIPKHCLIQNSNCSEGAALMVVPSFKH